MKKTQNIFLVGPMGAGKTTIGRYLAKELKREFYDSDLYIEQSTGVDLAWIFEIEGEAGFRKREQIAIEELTRLQGIVLATGGGTVLSPENRRALSARGIVIYLETTVEEQFVRVEKDRKRPLLQTPNREERVKSLHQERDPLYREIADYTFLTDRHRAKGVVRHILDVLRGAQDEYS